jgi:hypothetical protein
VLVWNAGHDHRDSSPPCPAWLQRRTEVHILKISDRKRNRPPAQPVQVGTATRPQGAHLCDDNSLKGPKPAVLSVPGCSKSSTSFTASKAGRMNSDWTRSNHPAAPAPRPPRCGRTAPPHRAHRARQAAAKPGRQGLFLRAGTMARPGSSTLIMETSRSTTTAFMPRAA